MATTRFSSKPIKKTEWSIFADFQKEGILTDSIIRGCDSEEEFKVHKLVLCASSPFFRKHIIDDEITYIIVNFIKSKIVKYILDYIYKGEAEVKTEEVTLFVDAASSLELEGFLSQNRNKKSDLITKNTKNTINKENILSNNIPILLDSDEEEAPIVNNISTSQPENNSFVESDDDVIFVESPQNSPGNAVFSNCSSESNLTNTKVSNNDSDDDVIIVVDDVDETQSTKNAINTEERLPTKNAVDTEERLPTKNAPRQINGVSRKRRLSKSCEHEITSEKLPRPDEKLPRPNEKLPRPNEKLPQRSPINNGKSLEPHAQKRPNRAKRVKNKDSCETISESCTQKPGTSNTFYNIPKSPAIKSAISKSQESVPENDHRPFFLKRVLFPNRTLKHFTPKSV